MSDGNEKLGLLEAWHVAKVAADNVKSIIEKEKELRKQVMEAFFEKPKEGTNRFALDNGWSLKFTYKLNKEINQEIFHGIAPKLLEMNINPDHLVAWDIKMNGQACKQLKELNSDAYRVFEECLTIKPGSHTLELEAPKVKEEK